MITRPRILVCITDCMAGTRCSERPASWCGNQPWRSSTALIIQTSTNQPSGDRRKKEESIFIVITPYSIQYNDRKHTLVYLSITFCIFFEVCWPLLCLCRPFCIFESCLDSNPKSCLSKQVRHLSPLTCIIIW